MVLWGKDPKVPLCQTVLVHFYGPIVQAPYSPIIPKEKAHSPTIPKGRNRSPDQLQGSRLLCSSQCKCARPAASLPPCLQLPALPPAMPAAEYTSRHHTWLMVHDDLGQICLLYRSSKYIPFMISMSIFMTIDITIHRFDIFLPSIVKQPQFTDTGLIFDLQPG